MYIIFIQKPESYNCQSPHSNGAYQCSIDGKIIEKGTSNNYTDIEVNAGETITFSVKARNNEDRLSDAATINITGPDAGE